MGKNQRRRRKKDRLVPNLLIAVIVVLVVFEGRLIITMVSHGASMLSGNAATAASTSPSVQNQTEAPDSFAETESSEPQTERSTEASASAALSSPAIVPQASAAVDDSYFSDAVFIGDSRMEGFRNSSGITQGTFYTSVGMNVETMLTNDSIATADGTATIPELLSEQPFGKIYIMLGTNDLGYYNWDEFKENFSADLKQITALQPNATLYICSVIYVEEDKVTTGDYVNNENVDKANEAILQLCEADGYHYINLNEVLDNGNASLEEGATVDGVHLFEKYSKIMLDYLKNHYL